MAADPHITYADFDRRGYAVLSVDKDKIKCEYKAVDALTKGATATETIAEFQVDSGDPTLHQVA